MTRTRGAKTNELARRSRDLVVGRGLDISWMGIGDTNFERWWIEESSFPRLTFEHIFVVAYPSTYFKRFYVANFLLVFFWSLGVHCHSPFIIFSLDFRNGEHDEKISPYIFAIFAIDFVAIFAIDFLAIFAIAAKMANIFLPFSSWWRKWRTFLAIFATILRHFCYFAIYYFFPKIDGENGNEPSQVSQLNSCSL